MPTTYRRTNTDSDLGGGADFSKAILPAASDTSNTQAISTAANSTEDDFGFTDVGVPGADGTTGDYAVEVTVTSGNTAVQLDCAVARVNSSGVQQAISSFAGEQTASAGTTTFNFTSVNLGTWAAGDRLRVTYRHRNTNAHSAQSFTIQHGTADSEVTAPWTAAGTGHTVNPDDSLALADARAFTQGQSLADTLALADARGLGRGKVLADTLALADEANPDHDSPGGPPVTHVVRRITIKI